MPGQAIVSIAGKEWAVDVATTTSELAAGLSGLASIPPDTGMLFDLGEEKIITVNAYEMLFPISVVFIGADSKVTEVAPLLAPGDDGTPILPCRFFLEVNVGEVDDVDAGDTVNISGYAPPVPTPPADPIDTSEILNLMVTVMIVVMMMKMMSGMTKGM